MTCRDTRWLLSHWCPVALIVLSSMSRCNRGLHRGTHAHLSPITIAIVVISETTKMIDLLSTCRSTNPFVTVIPGLKSPSFRRRLPPPLPGQEIPCRTLTSLHDRPQSPARTQTAHRSTFATTSHTPTSNLGRV
jgi:hypothetical protein